MDDISSFQGVSSPHWHVDSCSHGATDGSRTSTSRCNWRIEGSVSLLTIAQGTISATNLKISSSNILRPIWHLSCNPLMLGSSAASKHITRKHSASVLLNLMTPESKTSVKSTYSRQCWWQGRHGGLSIRQPSSTVGITQRFNCEFSTETRTTY